MNRLEGGLDSETLSERRTHRRALQKHVWCSASHLGIIYEVTTRRRWRL